MIDTDAILKRMNSNATSPNKAELPARDDKNQPEGNGEPTAQKPVSSSAVLGHTERPYPDLSELGLKAWHAGYRGHELSLPQSVSKLLG